MSSSQNKFTSTGVVFSGNGQYTLTARHHRSRALGDADLDLEALRDYIKDEVISRGEILRIRVKVENEGQKAYLRRGGTVYGVKFGTAQKLGYVCDQATAVLEIIRNNANVKKLDPNWRAYCLWLGVRTVTIPAHMSEVNSIILKQKIDAWARRCRELGIEPKLKFSRRVASSSSRKRPNRLSAQRLQSLHPMA